LRDRTDEIEKAGAQLVAIGTGDQQYAAAFARDTGAQFLVLVDDDSRAAHAASVRTVGWYRLLHPSTWARSREAWRNGYRVHKAGKRVRQLGATFVLGPGDRVRYSHVDVDSTDHAPIDPVLATLT
jgi:peroxiredoxin